MKSKIAVILTCHNRKEKTLTCLRQLYSVSCMIEEIEMKVFLTDDASTDGTSDAIRQNFPENDICILQGSGVMYWAGGMRFAWKEALKERERWDFYLLLNDDTYVMGNLFLEFVTQVGGDVGGFVGHDSGLLGFVG